MRDPLTYTLLALLRRAWHGLHGHPPDKVTDLGQLAACLSCTAVWGNADVTP